MSQPAFRPKLGKTVAATDLRQNMAREFNDITAGRGALVVTVAHRPRVVVADYVTYTELLYQAKL